MSQTKKIQSKIFRGEHTSNVEPLSAGSRSSFEQSQPALTINIPKPSEQPPAQPPPKLSKPPSSSPKYERDYLNGSKSFRERLADKLGEKYHGAERFRLDQDVKRDIHWKRWGPYVSDRQWVLFSFSNLFRLITDHFLTDIQATVREDYSANGDAWSHFPHEHARSRVYRWGEDGIAGISDNHQRLCFALSLWNGKDRMLKERLFGVTGHQGNHGEDVKELYYYLDSTPTHSYMKFLYKYPQNAFPYEELVRENVNRGLDIPEFEILDTGVFDDDRYWDVFVEVSQ